MNFTVGRFQPFTKGHLNMIDEGNGPCMVYQIISKEYSNLKDMKIGGRKVKPEMLKNVLAYMNDPGSVELTENEKEILKRPFSNDLVGQELDQVKRYDKNITDVIYVKNAYEALADFNARVANGDFTADKWCCGDDRVESYEKMLKTPKFKTPDGKEYDNVVSSMEIFTGSGRVQGVSGTAVRLSILQDDKAAFIRIMPPGTSQMFNEFKSAFRDFKSLLEKSIKESYHISLQNYITEHIRPINLSFGILNEQLIEEGGLFGHMKHVIDYTEMTCNDLIELIHDIFGGKIEHAHEKLDGTNLLATVNPQGQVVYLRNKGDLNSDRGGMSIEDMAEKWKDKPSVASNFIRGGEIIAQVLKKISNSWFNPDPDHKVIVNCECITQGQTNVMLYTSDRVAFHGTITYVRTEKGWEVESEHEGMPAEITKAIQGVDHTKPRPDLIINSVEKAQRYDEMFTKKLEDLWKKEGLNLDNTIEDWKKHRFEAIKPDWIDDINPIYNRWFNADKSMNLRVLKKQYADHVDELVALDKKGYKDLVEQVTEPLDILFLQIGNALMTICDGFTNQGREAEVVDQLKQEVQAVVDDVRKNGSEDINAKLTNQLKRLAALDDQINPEEGITFVYKGKLMKLTGSFAPLNQILGSIKFAR